MLAISRSVLWNAVVVVFCIFFLAACGDRGIRPSIDTTPAPYRFSDQTDVPLSTLVISDSIRVSGIDVATVISITGGEYSVDGQLFTSATGTVTSGQVVAVRHVSSDMLSTITDTSLNIGGTLDTFSSTTTAVDTNPDAYSFAVLTGVGLNSLVTSEAVTITGIDAAISIRVIDGEYSLDGAPFTDSEGSLSDGQTIRLRQTSSTQPMSSRSTYLEIGSSSATFTSISGPVGTGFNKARGANGTVNSIVQVSDGSGDVYIAGEFSVYSSTAAKGLLRLKKNGTVHSGFDVGDGFDGSVSFLSPADDGTGDLYVSGNFTMYDGTVSNNLTRLNGDGTIDLGFALGVGFDGPINGIAVAGDGSGDLFVSGSFNTYRGSVIGPLVRLNVDGSLDRIIDLEQYFSALVKVVSSADDDSEDVYVTGQISRNQFGLIRLDSKGDLDGRFDVGDGFNGRINSVSAATDGSGDLFVGGSFFRLNSVFSDSLVRLNRDGSPDAGFSSLGFSGTGVYETKVIHSVKAAKDGSGDVYIGGIFDEYGSAPTSGLVRLSGDGSIKNTAAIGGTGVNSISIATDSNDHVYVGGAFMTYNGMGANNLILVSSSGAVAPEFEFGAGVLSVFSTHVSNLVPMPDNSGDLLVLGNFSQFNNTRSNGLIRLNNDGSVDTAYIRGGLFEASFGGLRLTEDGSGDLYARGAFFHNDGTESQLAKLNADFTIDTVFSTGSGFREGLSWFRTLLSISPSMDGSGDLYVGGSFTSYDGVSANKIARLNGDGSVDTAFAVGDGFDDDVSRIIAAPDDSGDIYVGGKFSSYKGATVNRLVRLNGDGSIDSGFVVGSGFDNQVTNIVSSRDGSGDICVAGDFSIYNGVSSSRLVCLNDRGGIAGAFPIVDGYRLFPPISSFISGSGGDFYARRISDETDEQGIVRLNRSGEFIQVFAAGGFNGSIVSISSAIDDSGDVFVGGYFNLYQGTLVQGLVRLNPDASLN